MKKLLAIGFLLCAFTARGDTTYVVKERYMLFNDGYMRSVTKLYVDGKLRRKTITVDCMICTYRYTVRRRVREYN